jgi:hypothetical protein
MEMGNFNKTGKPLSARRIMAVKAAIDDAIAQKVDFLQEVATAGFWETDEIVNANRAANFYKNDAGRKAHWVYVAKIIEYEDLDLNDDETVPETEAPTEPATELPTEAPTA